MLRVVSFLAQGLCVVSMYSFRLNAYRLAWQEISFLWQCHLWA